MKWGIIVYCTLINGELRKYNTTIMTSLLNRINTYPKSLLVKMILLLHWIKLNSKKLKRSLLLTKNSVFIVF